MSAKPIAVTSPACSFELPNPAFGVHWAMTISTFSADLVTLALVFGLTVWVRHLVTPSYDLGSNLEMFPCLLLLLAAFGAKGLYPGVLIHPAEEMRRIVVCITTVFMLLAATTFIWHSAQTYSRSIFLVTWAAGAPIVLLTRYLVRCLLGRKSWWGLPAVVLGTGPAAQRVVRKLQDGMLGVRITAVLSDEADSTWPADLPPPAGGLSAARATPSRRAAQYAIVALRRHSNLELKHVIQEYCQGFSHVLLVPDMPGLCSLGVSTLELGGEVGFELPQKLFHTGSAIVKRVIDVALGSLALLIASPIFITLAILVKFTSSGPILYRQDRYGRNGKIFRALKFRTMVEDADTVLEQQLATHDDLRMEWKRDRKLKSDPRVTLVGKWLRRLSLDELPQLINVLIGQMSLVGPRPLPLGDVEKYGQGYDLYLRVRPGLTGLWQVSGRNNTTYEERIAFDEYYVRNWSIWLDTYILIRTVKAVATAEGAY